MTQRTTIDASPSNVADPLDLRTRARAAYQQDLAQRRFLARQALEMLMQRVLGLNPMDYDIDDRIEDAPAAVIDDLVFVPDPDNTLCVARRNGTFGNLYDRTRITSLADLGRYLS